MGAMDRDRVKARPHENFAQIEFAHRGFEHRRFAALFEPGRDIANGAELLKKRYLSLGNYERCIAEMDDQTFGTPGADKWAEIVQKYAVSIAIEKARKR